MKKSIKLFAIVAIATSILSCKKDEGTNPKDTPVSTEEMTPLTLSFDNVVGDKDLVLNDETYHNAHGDEYTVSMFNYYVSNIVLTRKDGSEYVYPKDSSYFLVKERLPETHNLNLNVPEGEYTAVNFVLGVDSLKSTAPTEDRIGVIALDHPEVMYWSWKSGYIFMKMEGKSPQSNQKGKDLFFHIGLFGGFDKKIPESSPLRINNVKKISIPLDKESATAKKGANPKIHIATDVNKLFEGSETVSFEQESNVMSKAYSKKVANNYQHAFSLQKVEI